MTSIEIRGARPHNLKGIDVDVPKHRLVAFIGESGSGKSSLVFDTFCTEARRELVETFSTSTSCSISTGASRRTPSAIPPTTLASGTGGRASRPRSSRLASRCVGSRRPSGSACCGRTACGSRRPTGARPTSGPLKASPRKLERLLVDKGRGADPARGQGGVSAAGHRAGVPRLRRRSARRRGARGGARGRLDRLAGSLSAS